jgi:putative tryptophan/tyrosine transport system substrate-binding protein
MDQTPQIVKLAMKYRLPTLGTLSRDADAGMLLTYGPDLEDLRRRSTVYVDKILRGAKPGDLPIQRPMKFEFVINMGAARTLGIRIPTSVMQLADRVID